MRIFEGNKNSSMSLPVFKGRTQERGGGSRGGISGTFSVRYDFFRVICISELFLGFMSVSYCLSKKSWSIF